MKNFTFVFFVSVVFYSLERRGTKIDCFVLQAPSKQYNNVKNRCDGIFWP